MLDGYGRMSLQGVETYSDLCEEMLVGSHVKWLSVIMGHICLYFLTIHEYILPQSDWSNGVRSRILNQYVYPEDAVEHEWMRLMGVRL